MTQMRSYSVFFERKMKVLLLIRFHVGNMSRGILRCRVFGSTMERGLQIQVLALLGTAAIHTETDLYHR